MTEKQIENDILQWLNLQPDIVAWKNNSMGVFDPVKGVFRKPVNPYLRNGVSDILGVFRRRGLGIFLALEVKTEKTRNNASVEQIYFIQDVVKYGGIASIVWNIDQVERLFQNARNLDWH